jgi:predicted MFS family arabinose efflux permease
MCFALQDLALKRPFLTALALSLGAAISLGMSRFSYALLLPPMRADLGWSYLLAGVMNTGNAFGYFAGALITPALMRKFGAHAALIGGSTTATGTHARFRVRSFAYGLASYFMFGMGYIGYMTFVVALLKEQRMSGAMITVFYALLGLAVVASSRIWAGMLDRFKGGESMAILNALLGMATLLPVLTATPALVFASGLLFGAVFLSVVASTTALVRHNSPPAAWSSGISIFTTVFAVGQIVGPTIVGWIADGPGGLQHGLVFSALALLVGAVLASRQRMLAAVQDSAVSEHA